MSEMSSFQEVGNRGIPLYCVDGRRLKKYFRTIYKQNKNHELQELKVYIF